MIQSASDLIKKHEGFTSPAKPDAKGKWVIGWGHDIAPSTGALDCTIAEAEAWFSADLALATARAVHDAARSWASLNLPRRAVLVDMAFEMGEAGLENFHDMLAAIEAEDWPEAARQGLASEWARTQAPARAKEDMEILLTGEWPEDKPTTTEDKMAINPAALSITAGGIGGALVGFANYLFAAAPPAPVVADETILATAIVGVVAHFLTRDKPLPFVPPKTGDSQ